LPQPKSSTGRTSSAAKRKSAVGAPANAAPKPSKPAAKGVSRSASAAKAAKPRAAKPKTAAPASKPAKATSAGQSKPKAISQQAQAQSAEDVFSVALGAIRDRLARGMVLTGERLQETIDDAARRGRLTHKDGEAASRPKTCWSISSKSLSGVGTS
jgi:cell division septation protein DedD